MQNRIRLLTYATLASTMFVGGMVNAAVVPVTLATQPIIVTTGDDITFSGAGSIVSGVAAATAIQVAAPLTAALNVVVGDTTAAKEISMTGAGGLGLSLLVANTGVGFPVNFTTQPGAVVEAADNVYRNASAAAASGAITIDNSGTIRATAANAAISEAAAGASAAPFALINRSGGLITSTASTGAAVEFVRGGASTGLVSITNAANATVSGATHGVLINAPTALGAITFSNSGSIAGTTLSGVSLAGIAAATAHAFTNEATGTISSRDSNGFNIATASATSTFTNKGTISSGTTAGGVAGIGVGANFGTIANTGTIQSTGSFNTSTGIGVAAGALTLLDNQAAGIIRSTVGSAVGVLGGSITTINNAGTITKGSDAGAAAIHLVAQAAAVTINQTAGTITGDVRLPTVASTVNLSGGALNGALTGQAAANVLNVAGSFTTGGAVSLIPTVNVTTAGATFTVGHAMTGVNTLLSTNVGGAKLLVKEAGSIIPAVNMGALTNTGSFIYEIGRGIATAGTTNVNGFIGAGNAAFNPTTGFHDLVQSGSGYIANNAIFYVVRTTGALTAGGMTASADTTANTPLLTFAAGRDAAGLFYTATRTLPAAVNFTRDDKETANARSVLEAVRVLGDAYGAPVTTGADALNPLFGAIGKIVNGSTLASETARLAPQVNGSATKASSVASQGIIGKVTMQRLADLRDGLAGERTSYAAGTHHHGHAKHAVWGQFVGNKAIQRTRTGIVGYDARTFGLALGGDMLVNPNFVAGIGFGYTKTGVDSRHAVRDRNDINSWNGSVYGSYGLDAHWYIDGSANFTRNRYSSRRNMVLPTISYAKYYGNQYGAKVMTGYHTSHSQWQITPMAGLSFSSLDLDTYTETSATTGNLRVASKTLPETVLSGGARFRFHHDVRGGRVLPELHAMLNYDVSARAHKASSQFVVAGAPVGSVFIAEGAKEPNFSWNAGLGLTLSSFRHWHATVQYDFTGKSNYSAHAGMMNLRYTW